MKIAVLTTGNQWFLPYAEKLADAIGADFYDDHKSIAGEYDILFILSYHRIIPMDDLKNNKHNIVIHASELPEGKGWAPMFWQVIEGRNEIPFTMFEASAGMDDGPVYMRRSLHLGGYELNDELRHMEAEHIFSMCRDFISGYDRFSHPSPQEGSETFYARRGPADSELNPDMTIREQFNLLRTVNNEDYPAFFEIDGHKYILKIYGAE